MWNIDRCNSHFDISLSWVKNETLQPLNPPKPPISPALPSGLPVKCFPRPLHVSGQVERLGGFRGLVCRVQDLGSTLLSPTPRTPCSAWELPLAPNPPTYPSSPEPRGIFSCPTLNPKPLFASRNILQELNTRGIALKSRWV